MLVSNNMCELINHQGMFLLPCLQGFARLLSSWLTLGTIPGRMAGYMRVTCGTLHRGHIAVSCAFGGLLRAGIKAMTRGTREGEAEGSVEPSGSMAAQGPPWEPVPRRSSGRLNQGAPSVLFCTAELEGSARFRPPASTGEIVPGYMPGRTVGCDQTPGCDTGGARPGETQQ
jgi:hypothetical protein